MTLKERFAFVFLWSSSLALIFAGAAIVVLFALAFFEVLLRSLSWLLGVTPLSLVTGVLGVFVGLALVLAFGQVFDWANNVNEARLKRQKGESNEA